MSKEQRIRWMISELVFNEFPLRSGEIVFYGEVLSRIKEEQRDLIKKYYKNRLSEDDFLLAVDTADGITEYFKKYMKDFVEK